MTGFQQGRYRILVATDLASRGIHVEDIAHVINYDLPDIAENFIHRVGRTGRAGGHGVASTLFGREQRTGVMALERTLGIRMERMRAEGDPGEKQPPAVKARWNVFSPTQNHASAASRRNPASPGVIPAPNR